MILYAVNIIDAIAKTQYQEPDGHRKEGGVRSVVCLLWETKRKEERNMKDANIFIVIFYDYKIIHGDMPIRLLMPLPFCF